MADLHALHCGLNSGRWHPELSSTALTHVYVEMPAVVSVPMYPWPAAWGSVLVQHGPHYQRCLIKHCGMLTCCRVNAVMRWEWHMITAMLVAFASRFLANYNKPPPHLPREEIIGPELMRCYVMLAIVVNVIIWKVLLPQNRGMACEWLQAHLQWSYALWGTFIAIAAATMLLASLAIPSGATGAVRGARAMFAAATVLWVAVHAPALAAAQSLTELLALAGAMATILVAKLRFMWRVFPKAGGSTSADAASHHKPGMAGDLILPALGFIALFSCPQTPGRV